MFITVVTAMGEVGYTLVRVTWFGEKLRPWTLFLGGLLHSHRTQEQEHIALVSEK